MRVEKGAGPEKWAGPSCWVQGKDRTMSHNGGENTARGTQEEPPQMLTQGAGTSGLWRTSAERGPRGLGRALEQMLGQAQGRPAAPGTGQQGQPRPETEASGRACRG